MARSFFTKNALQFLLTSIGIFLIGSLPYLLFNMKSQLEVLKMIERKELNNTLFLSDNIVMNVDAYFGNIVDTVGIIFSGNTTQYYARGSEHPLFPEFWDAYIQSMQYLIVSLIVALGLAILLTILTMQLPKHRRGIPKAFLFVMESLPDIFIILLTQITIIWIYKKTEILLFNIGNAFDERAILLPVLVLSLLPALYIYKYLLLSFEDEEKLLYVELARGKGLNRNRILLIHIFRNSIFTLFNHFKGIFLFALANLVMLEVIFELNGFMTFIFENGVLNNEIVTMGLFMIFLPSFLFFAITQWFLEKRFNVMGGL
ncbi:ABC transporter permease subunit [Alkalihalobacillus sp. R86527]|uniref:ABC transporter permease subunit n=1 Tax=Alkalihalobacillus sp. R86527 TaxID=3093863 RepID=UPI00366C4F53